MAKEKGHRFPPPHKCGGGYSSGGGVKVGNNNLVHVVRSHLRKSPNRANPVRPTGVKGPKT